VAYTTARLVAYATARYHSYFITGTDAAIGSSLIIIFRSGIFRLNASRPVIFRNIRKYGFEPGPGKYFVAYYQK
jgi:hypothetical protein